MRRGEVWVARLNPNTGAEIGKVRPVLVLQDDYLTEQGMPTVLVAPLTTQLRKSLEPLRVRLTARDRLRKDSHIMTDQLRALDRTRFGEGPLARLIPEELVAVERSLRVLMGMD